MGDRSRDHRRHDPARALEHEAPDQRGDDGRDRPGQEHGGAHQPAAAASRDRAPARAPGRRSSSVTLTASRTPGVAERAPEARVARAPRRSCGADERRPSHGIRRSCRCSDSQSVHANRHDRDQRDQADAPAARAPRRAAPRRAAPCVGESASGGCFMTAAPAPTARSRLRIAAAASCSAARGSCCRVRRGAA